GGHGGGADGDSAVLSDARDVEHALRGVVVGGIRKRGAGWHGNVGADSSAHMEALETTEAGTGSSGVSSVTDSVFGGVVVNSSGGSAGRNTNIASSNDECSSSTSTSTSTSSSSSSGSGGGGSASRGGIPINKTAPSAAATAASTLGHAKTTPGSVVATLSSAGRERRIERPCESSTMRCSSSGRGVGFCRRSRRVALPPPTRVRTVTWDRPVGELVKGVAWPRGLTRITFGDGFSQSLSLVRWPPGLEEVNFGRDFNEVIDVTTWPAGLKRMTFG
ncbi:unnamed protein product, partial [Ectocarpus sp. 8 AP-2014]